MLNPDDQVYCTNCIHLRIDPVALIPICPYEDECNILNFEDSMAYEDRPAYTPAD